MRNERRIFGENINFKSLRCAPVNELGVVYLFGVLHDIFDFKIESIQAGFPDCIARKRIGKNKWKELRIEFEYESISFKKHKHDPCGVDVIVCWTHNWKNVPDNIEVIELSKLIGDFEPLAREMKGNPKKLSEYQEFARQKRLEGVPFEEIGKLWKNMNKR